MLGMGKLTETEIFDCLSENFKLAAGHCEDLAKLPRKGPNYAKLRQELKLIEGAARQASAWRSDTRWLQIGLYMAECHKRAGGWLRGYKDATGRKVTHREGTLHPLFMKLADNLRKGHAQAEKLRTRKTGKAGIILPGMGPAPHRDTRPSGWNKTASGILVPAAA